MIRRSPSGVPPAWSVPFRARSSDLAHLAHSPTITKTMMTVHSVLVDSILQNPLNIALLLVFLYLLIPIIAPTSISRLTPTVKAARGLTESYSYLPSDHPKSTEWRKYTPRSLAIYDGTDGESNSEAIRQAGGSAGASADVNKGKILLCINRKVFDVTSGGKFYGPGVYLIALSFCATLSLLICSRTLRQAGRTAILQDEMHHEAWLSSPLIRVSVI